MRSRPVPGDEESRGVVTYTHPRAQACVRKLWRHRRGGERHRTSEQCVRHLWGV